MSWKMINRILGLASISPTFQQELQQDPQAALESHGFQLTAEELATFKAFAPLPFPLFCERVFSELAPEEEYP
ncbi:MAG TPA: Os1348 family NHLP clan protein [Ktedonosporobacter sp.]|jgi:hypothetical protein|nr:Os1348 family NHLP clan protein [Ktedonosporobacter sp.]